MVFHVIAMVRTFHALSVTTLGLRYTLYYSRLIVFLDLNMAA